MSTLEVLRVDPASTIEVGVPWIGYSMREQRFPVHGEGYQLWAITRDNGKRTGRILSGHPVTVPAPDAATLAGRLHASPRITDGVLSFEQCLRFVTEIEFAREDAYLIGSRFVVGIRGAVLHAEHLDERPAD